MDSIFPYTPYPIRHNKDGLSPLIVECDSSPCLACTGAPRFYTLRVYFARQIRAVASDAIHFPYGVIPVDHT